MRPQKNDPNWFYVKGVKEVEEFTEEILDHEFAGNRFEIGFHNLMKGVKWKNADLSGDPRIVCCTGTIEKMGVAGDSDIFVALKPNDCPGLMVDTNKGELECELPWEDRGDHDAQLLNLKKGGKVRICGYWIRDYMHPLPWQYKNEIHDITSIEVL